MANNLDDVPDLQSFIPQNIIEEIGRITVSFSFLEDELNGLITDLLGAGMAAGQAVTFTIRNITDRIELARTLVRKKVKFDDHRDEALLALKETEAANDRRNTLIHHAITRITFNIDPDAHLIEYRKKDFRIREKPKDTVFKAGELKVLRTDLKKITFDLARAALKHRVACGQPTRQP